MSKGKLVVGLIAGLAVGALLGVLFAPDKGAATRKKFSDKGQDYADELKDLFDEFIASGSEKGAAAKEETPTGNSKMKGSAEDFDS
ncbi:MAG: YtxH domain-containing protein [Bacteroidetes bacterium]|nr:YtxH domain-containing protein [Bacteroidota bacterium]